ncbi:MAG: ABC transporter permease [bacterium]
MSTESRMARMLDFPRTVLRLVRADLVKLSHYWVIIVGYVALFIIAVVGAMLFHYLEQSLAIVKSNTGYDFAIKWVTECVQYSAPFLYVMICILFAMEVSNSTIKNLLTRPVTRIELIVSKYITALIMIVAALLIFWFVALFLGWLYHGLGPLVDDTENECFSMAHMFRQMGIGTLFLLIPLFTMAAMALMVSSYSSTMGGAIIIGFIIFMFFEILAVVPLQNEISFTFQGDTHSLPVKAFFFTALRSKPLMLLDDLATCMRIYTWWTWEIISMTAICGIYFLVFFMASLVGVKKRDFTI